MSNPPPGLIRRSEGFMPFDATTRRDSIPHDTLQSIPATASGTGNVNPTAAPSSASASAAQQEWVSAPRWSQGLWSGQGSGPFSLSEAPKKTFRSLSFSQPQDTQRAGSHMLDTFNEEEGTDDELIDRLNATTLAKRYTNSSTASASSSTSSASQQSIGNPVSSSQQMPPTAAAAQVSLPAGMGQQQQVRQQQPQQQQQQQQAAVGQNLWFGAGRRHSYAGEHIQIPKLNTSVNTNSTSSNIVAVSPPALAASMAAAPVVVPGGTAGGAIDAASSQTVATNIATGSNDMSSEIDRYFSVDDLGRNSMDYDYSSVSPVDAAGLISVPSRKLYYVEFKSGRVDVFFIAHNSSLFVKVGDLVIVDADRGRDLGKIVKDGVTPEEAGMLKLKRHQEQQAILQHNPNVTAAAGSTPGVTMPKQILRFAQPNEAQQILSKQRDEEKAVAMCLQKVNEKGLAMTVLDAEYQWDRRKLTFFYSATHRIDFRDLVRDLFRIYKTRIWMCAVNTKLAKDSAHSPTAMMPSAAPAGEYGLFNNRAMPPPHPQMPPPPHLMSSAGAVLPPPPNGLPPPPHLAHGNMPPRFQSQFIPDVWNVPQQQPYRPEQQQQQQYWYY